MIKPNGKEAEIIMTPEQRAEKKAAEEKKRLELVALFEKQKEDLMRKLGVIEVAILKSDPMRGITPDSVIVPYVWKPNETHLNNRNGEKKDTKN
jgi:hypothetical protein